MENSTRSALFWEITQPILVILYRRFGTTQRSDLQGLTIQKEDGTDRFYRNAGKELSLYAA